jgi:hypothetical protein
MVTTSAHGRIILEGSAVLVEDPMVSVGAATGALVPVETVRGSVGRLPLVTGAMDGATSATEPLRMVGATVEVEALSSIRTWPEILGACDGELEMETVEFQPTVGEKVVYPSKMACDTLLANDGVLEGAREGSCESTMRIDGFVGVVDGNVVGGGDGAFDGGSDPSRVGGTVSKNANGFRVGGRVGDLVGGGRTGANVVGLLVGGGVGRRVGLRIGRGVGRRAGRLTGTVTGLFCFWLQVSGGLADSSHIP